jgi:hypothetical protein
MNHLKQDFQLVIIDSPYETWDDPLTESLFSKMVGLKRQGYNSRYPDGVLPVDTTDFLATHVLLCQKDPNDFLLPVMGYKTISLQKCRQYNLNFPGLSLVQNARMPLHSQVVENIIQRCELENRGLAYLGSWTVDPRYKSRSGPSENLRDAFLAFYSLLYREQNISEVVIGGTLRFGTEKIFASLGHRPLTLNGLELPPIQVAHLSKEPVLVMHSNRFSDASELAEKKWGPVWNRRIHIEANSLRQLQKRAA